MDESVTARKKEVEEEEEVEEKGKKRQTMPKTRALLDEHRTELPGV